MQEPQYIITNRTSVGVEITQASVPGAVKGMVVVPAFTSVPYGWFSCVGPKEVLVRFVDKDGCSFKFEVFNIESVM
jgi:hypothetical protein